MSNPAKPIIITKYQKWLSKSGNEKDLMDYLHKRIMRQLKLRIEYLQRPRESRTFNGYFTGLYSNMN